MFVYGNGDLALLPTPSHVNFPITSTSHYIHSYYSPSKSTCTHPSANTARPQKSD